MHSSPSPVPSNPIEPGSVPEGNKSQTRPVATILRDASIPFDRKSCVLIPFDDEVRRDAEFHQNLKDKQLEIIALLNSWVFSRLIAENESAGESLSHKMDAVAEAEREQERMRIQLENCVSNIRAALAALSRAVMSVDNLV
ncbi:hypothetical protein F5148DRAFT_1190895 [Russula earlei]|uniref:Uncharacterized protein n=1 Tax=Russula earlei TaxID=71964 RepID=A0ACC0UBQ3_9AGAM|nr:hypothetical protein F5148DRAFT_1190895 [Russula earlei]